MTATPAQVETLEGNKTESPVVKRKTWGRKLGKILLRVAVSLALLVFLAQLIWRFSGSNQWQLVLDKDGVKVYSLKSPGSDLMQLRAIGKIHSTVQGVVAWMTDPDACVPQGCTNSYQIEQIGEHIHYNYFQYDYSPFGKRDFVILSQIYQNPSTKEVLITVTGLADKVPLKDGFFRVTNLNNQWHIRPLDNGQVEIEIDNNMDPGGFVPNLIFNTRRPNGMYHILTHLGSWLAKDKYQNAKFDFLNEKNNTPSNQISQLRPAR